MTLTTYSEIFNKRIQISFILNREKSEINNKYRILTRISRNSQFRPPVGDEIRPEDEHPNCGQGNDHSGNVKCCTQPYCFDDQSEKNRPFV